MGMTSTDYLNQFLALLPRGIVWTREKGSALGKLLWGLAEEPARLDSRSLDLMDESDPARTVEMLSQWEQVFGLPDACTGELETLQERRAALIAQVTMVGGQSPGFFIAVAQNLGYEITITEYAPFRAGVNAAGDAAQGDAWQFAWAVNAPETTITSFRSGQSGAGEPLRTWGNTLLECAMERLNPAHTTLIFTYGE